ncbi:MAG: hypothetical protein F6K39_21365 [Okeania sp. SIO3B3]|nr:hypothetical protein [Okeania sp. SIO3B3]
MLTLTFSSEKIGSSAKSEKSNDEKSTTPEIYPSIIKKSSEKLILTLTLSLEKIGSSAKSEKSNDGKSTTPEFSLLLSKSF